MSNKTKLVKKNDQRPKNQREFIGWLFDQSFGKELLSSLGSKIGFQSIQSIEKKPSFALLSKKSKKNVTLPKLYFGARIDQQPWLLGVYAFPRVKNSKKTEKLVTKYLESLDKIGGGASFKTALIVISDNPFTKPETVSTSFGILSWKNFVESVKTVANKNLNSIPPFKFELISKWIEQWNFILNFEEIGKETFENLKIGVKVPYKFGKSSFSIKNAEKGSPVKIRGHLKGLKLKSSSFTLDLVFTKKRTKKWRRQFDVSISNLENELIEEFGQAGYTPAVKSTKPIEELNKKTLKKLAKKKNRLRFDFPMSYSANSWTVNEKPFQKALHEVTSMYVKKLTPLLVWKPEEEPEVIET